MLTASSVVFIMMIIWFRSEVATRSLLSLSLSFSLSLSLSRSSNDAARMLSENIRSAKYI